MKIALYFYTLPPFAGKVSRIKNWIYNATEMFIQFCTEHVWLYLEQDRSLYPLYNKPIHSVFFRSSSDKHLQLWIRNC